MAPANKTATLPAHLLRLVAVAANCDPRSVRRVLLDLPTAPSVRDRVARAIRSPSIANELRESLAGLGSVQP